MAQLTMTVSELLDRRTLLRNREIRISSSSKDLQRRWKLESRITQAIRQINKELDAKRKRPEPKPEVKMNIMKMAERITRKFKHDSRFAASMIRQRKLELRILCNSQEQ